MAYSGYGVRYYAASPYAPIYPSGQLISSGGEAQVAAPATIVVSLPADARLTVDDTPTKEAASPRRFVTPPLDRGKTYYYTLKGEIVRDGRTITTTKRITFRAGEEAQVSLEFDGVSVAQK
jgi:uncharacterized protein (TIGR03000 family)